ncbi:hypothetical protein EON67_09170, partial [archaeon]
PGMDVLQNAGFAAASASAPALPSTAAHASPTTATAELMATFQSPLSFFMPSFYVAMFSVDTADVTSRLKHALWPLTRTTFWDVTSGRPDLYGPVWIGATLSFVIGVGSNLSSWLSFVPEEARSIWQYDFTLLSLALCTVFGFVAAAAVAAWITLTYIGSAVIPLPQLVCIYGYSLTPYLVTAVRARARTRAHPHTHHCLVSVYLCLPVWLCAACRSSAPSRRPGCSGS